MVIVIRRGDINMRLGKCVAQGAHAALDAIMNLMVSKLNRKLDGWLLEMPEGNTDLDEWFTTGAKKICVGVPDEAGLLDVYNKAKEAGLNETLVQDYGLTEFKEPTYTAVAIGPAEAELIDKITGGLKLL
jgi:PTH2 family peptidyl-tRNA hydrolase